MHNILERAVQSRISKRAAKITNEESWKKAYRALGDKASYIGSKASLKMLHQSQTLDKVLLKQCRWVEYMAADLSYSLALNDEAVGRLIELEEVLVDDNLEVRWATTGEPLVKEY